MDHDDRYVLIAFGRNLVLDVHLVDGDVAACRLSVRAEARLRDRLVLAADEEAALALDDERAGGAGSLVTLLRRGQTGRDSDDDPGCDDDGF